MQTRNDRSAEKPITADEYNDLLYCRMAVLGLDLDAIERSDSETFDQIQRRCTSCGFGDACAVDLERDPNNPQWEAYCPNSEALNALTETWWLTP
jgi:hypothetical protein